MKILSIKMKSIVYPKQFRITSPDFSNLPNSLEQVVTLLASGSSMQKQGLGQETALLGLFADVAVDIWRMQRRVQIKQDMTEELRRISRDLESAWYALEQAGIEVKDHTGEKYNGGMALRVIAFEPLPNISYEQIIETIKPTIYYKQKLFRMGEVVVAKPVDHDSN
jgi:hypothetical protein